MKPDFTKHITQALFLMVFAPVAVGQTYEWTGAYGGINIGGIFNSATVNANHLGLVNLNGICNANADYSSFTSGLQLGYSHFLGSNVILGVEGDFTYNTPNSTNAPCVCPTNVFVADQFSFTNRLQFSARGRLGYALEQYPLLPFITAGASLADLGLNYSNESGNHYSKNTSQVVVGTGFEFALAPEWSVRGEYFYQSYGTAVNLSIPTIYGLFDSNGAASAKLNSNNIRLSVNYWFG